MTRTTLAALAAIASLTLAAILVPERVQASPEGSRLQTQRPWQRVVALVDYNRDDVRDALRELIVNTGLSYSIDPDVQGTVSLSLHNVTFENALSNVLRQANAAYRLEGGVIHVYRVATAGAMPAGSPPSGPTGPELVRGDAEGPAAEPSSRMVQDGAYIYVLSGAKVYKLAKSDLSIRAVRAVPQ
jgi:type II secretory pathway component GspD/PulD (secretin)